MSAKKIVQIRSSLYVLLPKGDCECFGFEKGNPIVVSYMPGVGFLITKQNPGGAVEVQVERVMSMKNYIDEMQNEFHRWVKVEVANAMKELSVFVKGGLIRDGMFMLAKLPEWFCKARLRPGPDPVMIEEIKAPLAGIQKKSYTEGQTRIPTRIQTDSQTVSRKKTTGVQKAHGRKGGPVKGDIR